jgi:hypothetical protein
MKAATSALAAGIALLNTLPSAAEEARAEGIDRFELSAYAETDARLFRRALLPGPEGALAADETVAPLYQYVALRVQNLDTSFRQDSVDIEVSGWARLFPTSGALEQPLDGDVQTAFVAYRAELAGVRLGRQQVVGGAARFARFDGVSAELELDGGFVGQAYGGLTVLPRWNERPGYYYLGDAAGSLLRDPTALEPTGRGGYWLAGARAGYAQQRASAFLSFHEQREHGELAHRDLGLETRARLDDVGTMVGSAVFDTDATDLADARLWMDFEPLGPLALSLEALHTVPALWLSRQSVLSVFSSDRLDEVGGSGSVRVGRELRLEGSAFATFYGAGRPGGRGEGGLRFAPDAFTVVRLTYLRLQAPENGYHALRSSLERRFPARLGASIQFYAYLYDSPIAGYSTSSVYAGTLSYDPAPRLGLLLGGSIASTPYAALDAQALLRATYAYDFSRTERAR